MQSGINKWYQKNFLVELHKKKPFIEQEVQQKKKEDQMMISYSELSGGDSQANTLNNLPEFCNCWPRQ